MRSKLYDESSGQLRRCFTRGPSAVYGFADDYAHVIAGLLELFAATGDVAHLQVGGVPCSGEEAVGVLPQRGMLLRE